MAAWLSTSSSSGQSNGGFLALDLPIRGSGRVENQEDKVPVYLVRATMLCRYSIEVQADDEDDAYDQAGQAIPDLGLWNDDTAINGDGGLEILDVELIAD